MKITHNKVGQNINTVDGAKSEKAGGARGVHDPKNALSEASAELSEGTAATKIDVSERALQARKIKDIANAVPDVDQDKVEKFRRLIDSGEYKVDSKAVADRMVDEHLDSKFD